MRKYQIASIFIALMFLVGCAAQQFTKNAYHALDVQATLYESARDLANSLPGDTWTAEEKKTIEAMALKYRIAYHAALEATIAYEELKDKDNLDLVNASLGKLSEIVKEFSEYVRRWE